MNKLISLHENFMKSALLDDALDINTLIDYHTNWIGFLQHERFVHLLVTLFLCVLLIITFGISIFAPNVYFYILFSILSILLVFYLFHYYKLENSVQSWYSLYDELMKMKKNTNL